MKTAILSALVWVVWSQTALFAQCVVPKDATYIPDSDVKDVLKHAPPAVDQQLRIVDLCKYNLAVGIIHRGPTQTAAGRGAAKGEGKAASAPRCNSSSPAPANAEPSGVAGISHDDETETYVIVSGGGTLVTGGAIVNGARSAPESEVTKVLNGPSCSGQIVGNVTKRKVIPGDVVIIPYGVPHGWTDIADHVDYLSVRPDPDHVLEKGYVNPAIVSKHQ
jgi:mannose-6-phosphate isomerase-like protein (cupin superfamily)